jgi:hypothetical protein
MLKMLLVRGRRPSSVKDDTAVRGEIGPGLTPGRRPPVCPRVSSSSSSSNKRGPRFKVDLTKARTTTPPESTASNLHRIAQADPAAHEFTTLAEARVELVRLRTFARVEQEKMVRAGYIVRLYSGADPPSHHLLERRRRKPKGTPHRSRPLDGSDESPQQASGPADAASSSEESAEKAEKAAEAGDAKEVAKNVAATPNEAEARDAKEAEARDVKEDEAAWDTQQYSPPHQQPQHEQNNQRDQQHQDDSQHGRTPSTSDDGSSSSAFPGGLHEALAAAEDVFCRLAAATPPLPPPASTSAAGFSGRLRNQTTSAAATTAMVSLRIVCEKADPAVQWILRWVDDETFLGSGKAGDGRGGGCGGGGERRGDVVAGLLGDYIMANSCEDFDYADGSVMVSFATFAAALIDLHEDTKEKSRSERGEGTEEEGDSEDATAEEGGEPPCSGSGGVDVCGGSNTDGGGGNSGHRGDFEIVADYRNEGGDVADQADAGDCSEGKYSINADYFVSPVRVTRRGETLVNIRAEVGNPLEAAEAEEATTSEVEARVEAATTVEATEAANVAKVASVAAAAEEAESEAAERAFVLARQLFQTLDHTSTGTVPLNEFVQRLRNTPSSSLAALIDGLDFSSVTCRGADGDMRRIGWNEFSSELVERGRVSAVSALSERSDEVR